MTASLLFAAGVFWATLRPQATPSAPEIVRLPIPEPKRVTLDVDESSLREVLESLSGQTGYAIRLSGPENPPLRTLKMRDVALFEALEEIRGRLAGWELRGRPHAGIEMTRVSNLPPRAGRTLGALRVELIGQDGTLRASAAAEPSQESLVGVEAELVFLRDASGEPLPFERRRVALPLGGSLPLADVRPENVARARMRVRAAYAVRERVLSFTAGERKETALVDGVELVWGFAEGDIEVRLKQVEQTAASRDLIRGFENVETTVFPPLRLKGVELEKHTRMAYGWMVVGGLRRLSLEVWPQLRKERMPFELRLPVEVETREVEVEFDNLRLR